MLFYESVCELELCARSVKIVIFDTSAIKMTVPQVWVCRPNEARVTITLAKESFFARVSNIIFSQYVCKVDTLRTECENSYFPYKCEIVILFSCRRLRPSEARVKRPHEDKITFSLAYRSQFFHTTCVKLDVAHAALFERAQSVTLRTECEKIML